MALQEPMFGAKVVAKKASKGGKGGEKKEAVKKIHVLEGKRSYNSEIFRGRLKMDSFANAEQVTILRNFTPMPEEAGLSSVCRANALLSI